MDAEGPIRRLQRKLEAELHTAVDAIESKVMNALTLMDSSNAAQSERENKVSEIKGILTDFTVASGETVSNQWRELFPQVVAQYRDGYVLNTTTPTIGITKMFYPKWWLEKVGYFERKPSNKKDIIYFQPTPSDGWEWTIGVSMTLFSLGIAIIIASVSYKLGQRDGRLKAGVASHIYDGASGEVQLNAFPSFQLKESESTQNTSTLGNISKYRNQYSSLASHNI